MSAISLNYIVVDLGFLILTLRISQLQLNIYVILDIAIIAIHR